MTALGPARIERSYARCPACEDGCFPADGFVGLDGWLTPRALEMAVLAGVHDPFRKAETLLDGLAGWKVDADTVRRRCHEQAALAAGSRADREALPAAFAEAEGFAELHLDAGKVNTVGDGWKDVKLAAFCVRPAGEACSPLDFGQRGLPAPSVRSVVAAVEGREDFGLRAEEEALRLGAPLGAGLSVLGDGAEWIWTISDDHFHGAAEVLDFWHAAQEMAEAGKAALGDGPAFRAWFGDGRAKLAADGYAGAVEALAAPLDGGEARRRMDEASPKSLNYFAGHQERMGYALRLLRGQAIGSGLVEGTIKQMVNIRMKRTGARWLVGHVGHFVELIALEGGPEWREHWMGVAA